MRERYTDDWDRDPRNGFARFGRWLASQPMTSWGFFAAGFIVARVLF